MSQAGWSPLRDVPGLLDDDRKAPLPVPQEHGSAYKQTLIRLIEGSSLARGSVEMATSTGSILLLGAQEVLKHGNRMAAIGGSAREIQSIAEDLTRSLLVIARERPSMYVLHQVAESLAAELGPPPEGLQLERRSRLKDLMTPLERSLEAARVPCRMEVSHFAALVVHLDDLYDDASVQIQRLFALTRHELPEALRLAPDFLLRLYTEFARASFSDHVSADRIGTNSGEEASHAGLLFLLPELVRALE
jgi:hypothetical protein